MKTTATKENSTPPHSSRPFLSKKAEGGFFAQTKEAEQQSFAPDTSRQAGAVGGHNFTNISIFPPRAQPVIQPKLTINERGDKYEQEADAMSERVMRMSAPAGVGGDDGIVQTKPLNITAIQRKCSACEEEETPLQTKPLMRKAAEGGGYTASPQLTSQLNNSKGGGDPLPAKTLGFMNQAFGADFSTVRIHSGSQAAEMSQGIQAKAFTHGSNIYFNRGQYSPESSEGKRLLGHELTHVVQQGGGSQNFISKKSKSMANRQNAQVPNIQRITVRSPCQNFSLRKLHEKGTSTKHFKHADKKTIIVGREDRNYGQYTTITHKSGNIYMIEYSKNMNMVFPIPPLNVIGIKPAIISATNITASGINFEIDLGANIYDTILWRIHFTMDRHPSCFKQIIGDGYVKVVKQVTDSEVP